MATTAVHVFARWKVKAGYLPTVLRLLQAVRSQTLQEAGNLFYKIHQSQADAHTLLLFEGYADAAAQQAHVQADYFIKGVVEDIVPFLEVREVILATPLEF